MIENKEYVVVGCGCRSQFCPDCAKGIGWAARHRLLLATERWQSNRPIMITLTCDQKNFDGPEQALDHVRKGGFVSRLIRELRRRNAKPVGHFFSVVEFQENGWPHWHVLVDTDFAPHRLVSHLWQSYGPDREGNTVPMGFVKITGGSEFVSREHAVFYVTKYIIKPPKVGYPTWLTRRPGVIFKRFSGSQGLFRDEDWVSPRDPEAVQTELERLGYPPSWDNIPLESETARGKYGRVAETIEGRVAKCGTKVTVFERWDEIRIDGQVVERKRWLAGGDISLTDVADYLCQELNGKKLKVDRMTCIDLLERLGVEVYRPDPVQPQVSREPQETQRVLFGESNRNHYMAGL